MFRSSSEYPFVPDSRQDQDSNRFLRKLPAPNSHLLPTGIDGSCLVTHEKLAKLLSLVAGRTYFSIARPKISTGSMAAQRRHRRAVSVAVSGKGLSATDAARNRHGTLVVYVARAFSRASAPKAATVTIFAAPSAAQRHAAAALAASHLMATALGTVVLDAFVAHRPDSTSIFTEAAALAVIEDVAAIALLAVVVSRKGGARLFELDVGDQVFIAEDAVFVVVLRIRVIVDVDIGRGEL